MSAADFPLTRKAGLHMQRCCYNQLKRDYNLCISPQDVEAWLAKAVRVYDKDPLPHQTQSWSPHVPEGWPTHQALLVCVEEIRQDAAEDILRELLKLEQSVVWRMPAEIIERARALLAKGE